LQNNVAVSQIKLIEQNKWRNTCKHHVARWQRPSEFLDETYPAKSRGM